MIGYCVREVVQMVDSSPWASWPLGRCFYHYIRVIDALFDPLGERIVYLTNSLVDEGRKNMVAIVAANIYTTRAPHA
jgi:hypothetical protein